MKMHKKIFISGTSGIGKTTLAEYLSNKLQIPFVNGSSTTLWKKYLINNHTELLEMAIKYPQDAIRFQYDLLDMRMELIKGKESFVTDRSPIDNAVYFLFQISPYISEEQTADYLEQCALAFKVMLGNDLDQLKLIYLSRDFLPFDKMRNITNDGKRIDNGYFQDMIDHLFKMVFDNNLVPILNNHKNFTEDEFKFIKVRDYNLETRKAISENFIDNKPTWFDKLFM